MRFIRWLLIPPFSLFAFSLALFLTTWVSEKLLGQWVITAILAHFYAGFICSFVWTASGVLLAPVKNIKVQRAIAFPIVIQVLWMIAITWDSFFDPFSEMMLDIKENSDGPWLFRTEKDDAIAFKWRMLVFTGGFIIGFINTLADELEL